MMHVRYTPQPGTLRCEACPLRSLCLDHGPPDAPLPQVCQEQRCVQLETGEHLFRLADPVDHMVYIIRSGYLKQYQHGRDGCQHIVDFPGPGAWVGLESLFQPQRQTGAIALCDCEVVIVPFTRLSTLLDRQPQAADIFGHLLSGAVALHQKHAAMLRGGTALQRIAQFLLERAAVAPPGVSRAALPMSRQDIGDYLGLTASTVSRWMSELRRRGWLTLGQRGFSLPDRDAVAQLAAGAPLTSPLAGG